MASRKAEKEAARQRRLEQERAAQAVAQRKQRMVIAGSLLIVVIAVAVVLVVTLGGSSSSNDGAKAAQHPTSAKAKGISGKVNAELDGIPQSGTTLGNPNAKVTITEYGDLQCPICADFAKTSENQLISNEVKTGKVKLVYKSLETATGNGPDSSMWLPQQSGAYAAGAQGKAWNYIEIFYHEQGAEGTNYVNTAFLQNIAKQVKGLNYSKWNGDRFNPAYQNRVISEGKGFSRFGVQQATPTLIVAGPHNQLKPLQTVPTYSQLQSMIKQVS
ncbi:MAG TPA: thioredoxin domain-containing protein [Solirubrobacteraceae bacterium]|nr:thioredoxin domain-containing protein [Solirubrobacteraceae bacterium]